MATSPTPATPRSMSTLSTSVAERSLTVAVSAPPSACRVKVSTSSASITMFPMLRVNSSRDPLADAVKISAPAEPLKRSSSRSVPPSTMSLPSPGSQTNASSPVPRSATSAPTFPSTVSPSVPPTRMSLPFPPFRMSFPTPPSRVSSNSPTTAPPEIVSSPPRPFTVRSSVVRASGPPLTMA